MSTQSKPTLLFFGNLPKNWRERPELISSLQSWETALLLLGLRRFPPSLVTLVSAIESLLKPEFPELEGKALKERRSVLLKELLDEASQRYRWSFSGADLDRMRRKRNDFAHKGFIPKDDAESIELLFKIAFPLIAKCLEDVHSYKLSEALADEYSKHLKFARQAYFEIRKAKADYLHCVDALIHLLTIFLRNTVRSIAMEHAENRSISSGLGFPNRTLKGNWRKLRRTY